MSVSSADLVASVKRFADVSTCEADWRGVCARAYYAIYDDGRLFHLGLASPGVLRPGTAGGMHVNLIEQLINPTVPKGSLHTKSKQVGYLMKTMHALRVKADYKRDTDIGSVDAKNAVIHAEKVAELIVARAEENSSAQPLSSVQPGVDRAEELQEGVQHSGPKPGRPTLTRLK